MENKAHALAAGLFVALVAAMLVALAAWLSRDTGVRDVYEISTREIVTGLQSQAAVRYRGVDVGKVSWIGFDSQTPGNVLMRLEIDQEAPVTGETYATLSYQGVTGLAFVQLDDTGKPAPRLQTDSDRPARIALRPSLLTKLAARGEGVLEQVEKVSAGLDELLGPANQRLLAGALDKLGTAATDTSRLAQRLSATLDQRMDPALAEAATTLRSVQKSAEEVGRTAAEFGKTAQLLGAKDGPVDRLTAGALALSRAAETFTDATLPRINRVSEEASRSVRRWGRAAGSLTDNPQSLIFGAGRIAPGPGEPGFTAQGAGQ